MAGAKEFMLLFAPKEMHGMLQYWRPTGENADQPNDRFIQICEASKSESQFKGASPRSIDAEAEREGPLSPRHTKQLCNLAHIAKEWQQLCNLANIAKANVKHRFQESQRRASLFYWVVVIGTAVLSSLLSYCIDQTTWLIGTKREQFSGTSNYSGLGMVIIFNVSLVIVARLFVRTTVEAEGSGFPEVKAMLFGKVMSSFLTIRVLTVKAVALSLGVSAGLPLGKEGPNVHMAACISRNLGSSIYESTSTLAASHLLLAACAVGVGSSFSAPVGGVIFSLELVLPQIFDYFAYTGCILSAVTGSICYASYRTWTAGSTGLLPLMSTDVLPNEGVLSEHPSRMLLVNIAVGCLCGLLGGIWIRLHAKVVGAMKRWRTKASPRPSQLQVASSRPLFEPSSPLAKGLLDGTPKVKTGLAQFFASSMSSALQSCQWRDLFQIIVVVIFNTVGAASLPLLGGKPQPALLSTLFSKDLFIDESWVLPSLGPEGTMATCFLFKWTITIFALSLPCPAGVVAPTMIIGALLGRCLTLLMPLSFLRSLILNGGGDHLGDEAVRGAFMARMAIVGAAAFSAAVCRAFAMAITVFEVLALPNLILPLYSSSLAAIFVANRIALPYFDTNLIGRGLGGISAVTHTTKAMDPAFSIMRRVDIRSDCLEEVTTVGKMLEVLENTDEEHIPIVQSVPRADTALLKGSISHTDLGRILEQLRRYPAAAEVKLTDPAIARPADGSQPLVQCVPAQVGPDTPAQDVYLLLKMMKAPVIYVTQDNCIMGVINFKELLGHKLN